MSESHVPALPAVVATRYVQPLREGGSLPAIVETHDGGLWVAKFRGAGQGAKVLVAELIAGLLARALHLPAPELAVIEVPPPFGRSEPDPEIQDLLRNSHGTNIGLRYLDGAFNYDDAAAGDLITPDLAARIVWFDALLTNPDRTHRNPNMLVWERAPWLIDHGAALYVHHDWASADETRARAPFPLVRQHVLLARASDIRVADAALAPLLTPALIDTVLARVPDELLADTALREFSNPDEPRAHYRRWLAARLAEPRAWVAAAEEARTTARTEPPRRVQARR